MYMAVHWTILSTFHTVMPLPTFSLCHRQAAWMGNCFQMALFQGCRERRVNTISELMQQPPPRGRCNQSPYSTLSSRASKLLRSSQEATVSDNLGWDRPLNSPDQRRVSRGISREHATPGTTVHTPDHCNPDVSPAFFFYWFLENAHFACKSKELPKMSSSLHSSVRILISKYLPDCREAGHLHNLKTGQAGTKRSESSTKSFPRSAHRLTAAKLKCKMTT